VLVAGAAIVNGKGHSMVLLSITYK